MHCRNTYFVCIVHLQCTELSFIPRSCDSSMLIYEYQIDRSWKSFLSAIVCNDHFKQEAATLPTLSLPVCGYEILRSVPPLKRTLCLHGTTNVTSSSPVGLPVGTSDSHSVDSKMQVRQKNSTFFQSRKHRNLGLCTSGIGGTFEVVRPMGRNRRAQSAHAIFKIYL